MAHKSAESQVCLLLQCPTLLLYRPGWKNHLNEHRTHYIWIPASPSQHTLPGSQPFSPNFIYLLLCLQWLSDGAIKRLYRHFINNYDDMTQKWLASILILYFYFLNFFIFYRFIDSMLNCRGLETHLLRFLHNIIRKRGFLPLEKLSSAPLLNGMTSASETPTHTHARWLAHRLIYYRFTILKAQTHCQIMLFMLLFFLTLWHIRNSLGVSGA